MGYTANTSWSGRRGSQQLEIRNTGTDNLMVEVQGKDGADLEPAGIQCFNWLSGPIKQVGPSFTVLATRAIFLYPSDGETLWNDPTTISGVQTITALVDPADPNSSEITFLRVTFDRTGTVLLPGNEARLTVDIHVSTGGDPDFVLNDDE